jgi:phage gp36-like protein
MTIPEFATIADMEARFDRDELVHLTNQSGDDGIDAARLNQQLKRANNEVLSHIAAKYDVGAGLDQVAIDRLCDIACDLARYYLYRETPADGVKDRYQMARADLRDLRDGKTKLDTGSQEVTARPEGVLISAPDKIFGRDSMSGF